MYLTSKQDAIAKYLAQGLKPSQVASLTSVTPAYISQLVKQEEFLKEVEARRENLTGTELEVEERINSKYLALEDKLLDKIGEAAEYAEGRDLSRFLEVVTNRHDKRLARQRPTQHSQTINVVSIALPAHAAPAPLHYQLNDQSQITAIGNRLMAPLSAEGVRNLFTQMGQQPSPNEIPADL